METDAITLGEYIFLRVLQANPKLKSVFGIPGDFTLNLLECLYGEHLGGRLEYYGFCNELNAGYASDGYAKVLGNFSVLVTTFGVGELSAINAISGSFAEYTPVLHIIGTTSTQQVEYANQCSTSAIKNIHHLAPNKNPLLPPDHDVYKNTASPITVANESLSLKGITSGDDFEKIDLVLKAIISEARPGYLYIPSDLPNIKVPKSKLDVPFNVEEISGEEGRTALESISRRILKKIYESKHPAVLEDVLLSKFGSKSAFDKLISKLPANFVKLFSTNLARSTDETSSNYVGTYFGSLSSTKELQYNLEKESDCVVIFGYNNTETNTAGYSCNFSDVGDYIEIHPDYILIDGEYFHIKNCDSGTRLFTLKSLIEFLEENFNTKELLHYAPSVKNITYKYAPEKIYDSSTQAKQDFIPQTRLVDFFNDYLQPNDLVVVETCSFLFAMQDILFPRGVKFVSQNFYGSIGYSVPACFGAALAARDTKRPGRVILIVGDGSAQMTIQELTAFLRYNVTNVQIFVINNGGYTVERMIKGPTRAYNDIYPWNWCQLLQAFGDPLGKKHKSAKLKNVEEFDAYFKNHLDDPSKIELLDLTTDPMDSPERFKYISGAKKLK